MANIKEIDNLIVDLIAICEYSKDIHYNAKGDAFYSKHLLVDRVAENIKEYLDKLKEVFYLPVNKEPLPSKEYLKRAIDKIPEIKKNDKDSFINLADILVDALRQIEKLKDLTKGEENLIGAIGEDIQTSLGLINRQIKDNG